MLIVTIISIIFFSLSFICIQFDFFLHKNYEKVRKKNSRKLKNTKRIAKERFMGNESYFPVLRRISIGLHKRDDGVRTERKRGLVGRRRGRNE